MWYTVRLCRPRVCDFVSQVLASCAGADCNRFVTEIIDEMCYSIGD